MGSATGRPLYASVSCSGQGALAVRGSWAATVVSPYVLHLRHDEDDESVDRRLGGSRHRYGRGGAVSRGTADTSGSPVIGRASRDGPRIPLPRRASVLGRAVWLVRHHRPWAYLN